jgi:thiamine biosynthesis lipoprotein
VIADCNLCRDEPPAVARTEQRYSRYRSDSVLAEINNVAQRSGSVAVDEETAKLLD